MGTVYHARDTVLDREVALKTIRTGSDVDPELRERFYREARACARLKHPGIVAVYDMGEIDATAFIAMELLVGSDLRKLIEQKPQIPLAKKLSAMITICQALADAHGHGITHRDIKPSNLFLLEDERAKVLDFGIARLPSSQLTVAGKILGTPNYMAPEQLLMKPSGPRSDMFSAAVVFFEFLVYKHPFQSRLIMTRIAEGDPDSLFDHDSRMPILLDRILRRAMSKDPEERYRTCNELADDLKAVLDSVNNNASPSFEPETLPSDRAPVNVEPKTIDPAFAPNPSLLKPAPQGEDEHEWRLSEVLRLIPEFEGAVDRRDAASAKRLFTELVTIQSVDGRFGEAVELCRTKLGILDVPPEAPSALPAEPPSSPKYCLHCRAANRTAAVYCIQCGATFPESDRPKPVPVPAPLPMMGTVDSDATIVGNPESLLMQMPKPVPPPPTPMAMEKPKPIEVLPPKPGPKAPPPVKKPGFKITKEQQRIAVVAGGTLAVIALLTFAFTYLSRPVPVEAWVATASLGAAKSGLAANPGEAAFQELNSGQRLNILKLPGTATQEWIQAQFVPTPADASKPGFIRISDLDPRSWQTESPDDQLALIRLFRGVPGARPEAEALQALIDAFPQSQAARDAQNDLLRFAIEDLKRQTEGGTVTDIPAFQARLTALQERAATAGDDPSIKEQIDEIGAKLKELEAAANPPKGAKGKPPVPARPPGVLPPLTQVVVTPSSGPSQSQLDAKLAQGRVLLSSGKGIAEQLSNAQKARSLAQEVLGVQSSNKDARSLREDADSVIKVLQ
jgi:serine/threonine protein kinase